jgi:hypothetical protein
VSGGVCLLATRLKRREGCANNRLDRRAVLIEGQEWLVLVAGRERTAVEFRVLLDSAGFALTRILPTPAQWSVVEGVRL